MLSLLLKSIRSRIIPTSLVTISLMASMVLLLSIERIQQGAEEGFNQSISGVDVIIGPRSSSLELVLYTVFHLGRPTNNITTKTIDDIKLRNDIDWIVPIALGDSHKGFRVIATQSNYFEHIKYSDNQSLTFLKGRAFSELPEVVLGSDVADKLNYSLGSNIQITHGSVEATGNKHDDFSFKASGILNKTGTPIDQAIFVDLKGYELLHLGWKSGKKVFSLDNIDLSTIPKEDLNPKTLTAAFVGLKSKLTLFNFSKSIREYPNEAISAVIPGVALSELWSIVGLVDKGFELLSWIIIAISLIAMITLIIASLDNRKQEMTIYRANGASPRFLATMVIYESLVIGLVAIIGAIILVTIVTYFATSQLNLTLGISPSFQWISLGEIKVFSVILLAGVLSSLIPAVMVFRKNLHQTLS
ncbi:MAG: putative ABC transport system permease protein [Brevundimonas sp.]|jgi:putative ABC transport system permease protein|tara:strand:+ start:1244 stop:2491 length:1248 start_codon:yes stop_codon:yes gene_type:complete